MAIDVDSLRFIGEGLNRPECVVAHSSGLLIAPDWTEPGGVSLIEPSGRTRRLLATRPGPGAPVPLRPNGIALEDGGSVLCAHLGAETGGVYRLWPDGRCETVVDQIDGAEMPPANFVAIDGERIWITVSTTKRPRALDYRPDAATGFIALFEAGRARIVADGLGYTNECLLTPNGDTLFVNETYGRRLSAFTIRADGGLGEKRVVARFGEGTYPDGLTFAADGSILVTSVVSNQVLRVAPESGRIETLLEDSDAAHLAWVERAFQAGEMGRPHVDEVRSRRLRNISNLAFGGEDLRTAYLGCLLGDRIACFDAPMTGLAPPHWTMRLGDLASAHAD